MSADSRPILRLGDLKPGQSADFYALLSERTKGTTREGKPYYTCRFRDARRAAAAMVWNDSAHFADCESQWKEGQFFRLRATFGEHVRYGPQIDILSIRPATDADRAAGFDRAALVDSSRFDPEAMYAELRQLVEKEIGDKPLRRLTLGLLAEHAERLKRVPATQNKFHPFAGGLLEHTLSVTKSCLLLADRYVAYYADLKPPLNRDLLLAGAALHDLGRVLEFEDELGLQHSVEGKFFGHLALGRDLVRDAAREQGDVDPVLVQMLEHLVHAHLALPEWGSPRLPLIPEVLILHHLDDLDAKLEMYARCLGRDKSDGPFTERDPVLGKALFKGRNV